MALSKFQEKLALLEKVREQERAAVREAALKSTWIMATMVLWPDTDTEKIASLHYDENAHKPLCDWIDSTPTGGQRAIILHREARKTMLLNIAHCVRLIAADPTIRIILITALQRTAYEMCGLVKRQFMLNPSFRYYFPELAVDDPKWGKVDEFVHPAAGARLGKLDVTMYCVYTGAALISRRCDVLKFDDPVADDDVLNPDTADGVMRSFLQTIPLIDKTSKYKQKFFIGTYKSHLDPASAITGKSSNSDHKSNLGVWEYVIRPVAYVPNGDFHNPGDFAFPDENSASKPFLPTIWTPAEIRKSLNEALVDPKKGESWWMREYGCMVMAPGDQKFLPEWLDTWIDPPQFPVNTVFSGVAVDSALKDEQVLFKGDNMVILIGHFDQYGRLYLTDGVRSRSWRTEDFRRVLLSMVDNPKNRQPENFVKEKVGEGTLFPMVRGWFNTANKPIILHPLKVIGQGKKHLRVIESLQGPFMARKIFFVRGQFPEELHKVLVDELTHLGQWGHDDVADCLSLFFHPDIRVVPDAAGRKVVWKDPVTRPAQISTVWTNPGALSDRNPKPSPNLRLSPFGEEYTFVASDFSGETSLRPMAEWDEASWEKVKHESSPQISPSVLKDPFGRTAH